MRSSIDPEAVETTTCVAKVLRFCDQYEEIRQKQKIYVETGSTQSPNHGRGQRISKKNTRYEHSIDEDYEEENPPAQVSKRPRKSCQLSVPSRDDLAVIRGKYKLDSTNSNSKQRNLDDGKDDDTDCSEFVEEENGFEKENDKLKKIIMEKNMEIHALQRILKNMKDIPMLQEVVKDLKTQMEKVPRVTTTRPNSPIILPASPIDVDSEVDLVTICPDVEISNGQYAAIKHKKTAKEFIYILMSMVWRREVLATHSVSGKTSNAFQTLEAKPQLDPSKVMSICEYASKKYGIPPSEAKQIKRSKVQNVSKVVKAQMKIMKVEG